MHFLKFREINEKLGFFFKKKERKKEKKYGMDFNLAS
jgi:hypothetical protein